MSVSDWRDLRDMPLHEGEPVFGEPWQAQIFALTVQLNERGVLLWSDWASLLGAEIAANESAPYWICWHAALEKFLAGADILSRPVIEQRTRAWHAAAARTPHGEPINLSNEEKEPS